MSSSPPIVAPKSKHQTSKHKSKVKEKSKVTPHLQGRNDGDNPNWAFQPPNGMVSFDTSKMDEGFDWDSFKNDENKELWIMRVPEGFKLKQLDGFQVRQPRSVGAGKLSTLERKRAKYDVWSAEPPHMDQAQQDDMDRSPIGEEIQTVSCLLPRKKKGGKLYIASKPIAQHIIITHAPAEPHVDTASFPVPSTRHSVPKHLLKHRFLPFGAMTSASAVPRAPDAMDVDEKDEFGGREGIGGKEELIDEEEEPKTLVQENQTPSKGKKSNISQESSGETGKKRKNVAEGEAETHKRLKRLKF